MRRSSRRLRVGAFSAGFIACRLSIANVKGYFTNSAPVDAYRGAGRPEAAYLMERLMDVAAVKLGLDKIEIRKRNLPTPEELPYKNWAGIAFDSGDYPFMIDQAMKRANTAGFAERRKASEARGKKRGLGIAYYVEITAAAGSEPAAVKFTDNGAVELYVGTQSNGQGHETAFAQVVAERLGVPFESIMVKQGDSDWVNGGGTGGSRSLNMAGGALEMASDTVIAKGKTAAGQVLQAGGEDVAFDIVEGVGSFQVAGSERKMTLSELAVTLKREKLPGFEDGLDSDALYQGSASTFPNGCHICEVEIDPETGKVDVVSYAVLDDFGRVINPMLVAGQVHGGVAQGLGQALLENCVYDAETGQILSASFTDYAMPRADDLPDFQFAYEAVSVQDESDGRERLRRSGNGRRHAVRDERDRRRHRRGTHRYARNAGTGLARDAERLETTGARRSLLMLAGWRRCGLRSRRGRRRIGGLIRSDRLRQGVAFVAIGRADPNEFRELSLRRNKVVHVEIKFAQIFMRAFVVGIFLKRFLIEYERHLIIADHSFCESKIIQNVCVMGTIGECALKIGNGLRIFLVMDQPQRLRVIVELGAAAHAA